MRAAATPSRRSAGFTLVELLVVLGVIGLLIAILMPTVTRVRQQADAVRCGANLRQIGNAFQSYLNETRGYSYPYRNWGRWKDPADPAKQIKASHPEAYWGVAYAVSGGLTKEAFHCPSARDADPASADGTFAEGNVYTSYGLNGWYGQGSGKNNIDRAAKSQGPNDTALFVQQGNDWNGRNFRKLKDASRVVVAQDAWEAVLDGNGDTFDDWRQWPGKEFDWLRHNKASNVLFADMHVAQLSRDEQSNYRYYGGKW